MTGVTKRKQKTNKTTNTEGVNSRKPLILQHISRKSSASQAERRGFDSHLPLQFLAPISTTAKHVQPNDFRYFLNITPFPTMTLDIEMDL